MKSSELRKLFIDFFASKDHYILPSHSLIPDNDNTLLWINSGIAPLKKYYSKKAIPPSHRMANSQKSLRTNDIDNVGKTDRHHTMFEMLGNFSIGDYFKKEAIAWAWEFMTQEVKLDTQQLYVTIHPDDDEAFDIWTKEIGLASGRIYRDPENFWEIGPGPCGPNSEIYYDRGEQYGCGSSNCQPGCDCDRYLEVWNLVFTQFNREVDGGLTDLPYKNIDTGMGLERLASVVQKVDTNFETDLFLPIIRTIEDLCGLKYEANTKVAMRVIADHVRSVAFAIADGAMPSNEGRGYIIRRLLRRAVRYGKKLNLDKPFLYKIVNTVVEVMSDHYTYLPDKQSFIERIVLSEEERFLNTLEEGEKLLTEIIENMNASNPQVIAGSDAFKLYDTYGFPLELTSEIAEEYGYSVDVEGFNTAMEEQRERARQARKGETGNIVLQEVFSDIDSGDCFTGYSQLTEDTVIIALQELSNGTNPQRRVEFLLLETPFYAESGGQVADIGTIKKLNGRILVNEVKKLPDGRILHKGDIVEGEFTVGDHVVASVDTDYRQAVKVHHTSTHLLHQALKNILGDHVNQAGSQVRADRLRFDFTHYAALTSKEITNIENEVNQNIFKSLPVIIEEMTISQALDSGATALFGEKYGDTVRVVAAGAYSKELCGGTHLASTAEAGIFLILSEGSIGSGIRRIEAIAGRAAYDYIKSNLQVLKNVSDIVKAPYHELPKRIEDLQFENNNLQKNVLDLQQKIFNSSTDRIIDQMTEVEGVPVLAVEVDAPDMAMLRQFGDTIKAKRPDSVIVLGSCSEDKVYLLAMVSDRLVKEHKLHAGKIIKEVSAICGGGGGGKPQMAQAGGKNPAALPEALQLVKELVREQVGDR